MFRKVIPLARGLAKSSVGRSVKKSLTDLALDTTADVLSGKTLKESAEENLRKSKQKIAQALRKSKLTKRRSKIDVIPHSKKIKKYHLLK